MPDQGTRTVIVGQPVTISESLKVNSGQLLAANTVECYAPFIDDGTELTVI